MKRFYIGQPLIIKEDQKKVNLVYDDKDDYKPYSVMSCNERGRVNREFYHQYELEPSTEFKFSQIIAGLEQGYFEVGTEFRVSSDDRTIIVKQGDNGLCLKRSSALLFLTSKDINSTWTLVEPRKEMTLEEIESELGYKIKLKDNGGN